MKKDPVQAAAEAHTDLNTFGSIISLLEGGHLYCTRSQKPAQRIIDLCKAQQARLLRDYDANVERAKP
ncbi:hypothetical protein ACC783_23815 [Rhizobium ruizarguesonis]